MNENKVKEGDTVSLHYRGTFDDGVEFDSSHFRGEPLVVTVGSGQLIPGFDNALTDMAPGEVKNISVAPNKGYGPVLTEAVQVLPKTNFPSNFDFTPGTSVSGQRPDGAPLVATIVEEDISTVTLDFNHPMAGKNLNFEIELLEIKS